MRDQILVMDRLVNRTGEQGCIYCFKVIKARNDWHDVRRPQVAMHRDCHLFIYLKSTTEGPEGHLYCRKNTETHKKTKKTNKQTI